MNESTHTWREIVSQPRVWRATLDRFEADRLSLTTFLDEAPFDHVAAIGCGSTHYLAQAAATTLSCQADVSAQALPSSEVGR